MKTQRLAYFGIALRPDGRMGLLIVRRVRNGSTFKQESQRFLTPSWPSTAKGRNLASSHIWNMNQKIADSRR